MKKNEIQRDNNANKNLKIKYRNILKRNNFKKKQAINGIENQMETN